jgi:hypothetical protein
MFDTPALECNITHRGNYDIKCVCELRDGYTRNYTICIHTL